MLDADAPVLYVATARGVDPGVDPEWADRVAVHRARRPAGWRTVEDADLPTVLDAHPGEPVLVDDLATWVTGLLDDAGWERDAPSVDAARASLTAAVERFAGTLVLVSAEVGLGVVPSTRAGRLFRDELGALNAALAAVCDEVLLLVAGLPLRLK